MRRRTPVGRWSTPIPANEEAPEVTITGKIRTTLAVAAAAVAVMTVASPAAPAEAAVGSISPASLSVSAPSNGLRTVVVSGVVRTSSRTEALQLYGNGYRVVYRLWGDDPSSDDLLWDLSYVSNYDAEPDGLHFSGVIVMQSSYLNEDTCWCDDRDEVYAGIRLINSSGTSIRSAESNRTYGYY
jgi:hypothetical protein